MFEATGLLVSPSLEKNSSLTQKLSCEQKSYNSKKLCYDNKKESCTQNTVILSF